MNNTNIATNSYLTDIEYDIDDEIHVNIYTFLCTQAQENPILCKYFWDIGLFDQADLSFFGDLPYVIHDIYHIVNDDSKRLLRTQYIHSIRKLMKQPMLRLG